MCNNHLKNPVDVENAPFWMNKRPKDGKFYQPTYVENVANTCTHGIFILPCCWMSLVLYNSSTSSNQSATAILYGGALVQLLLFSTVHHLLSLLGHNKSTMGRVAHVGDRVAIFIFIAASYTPWLVLRKYEALDPFMVLYAIWFTVVFGLIFQIFCAEKFQNAEVVLYIAVGLCPAAIILRSICYNGWHELALGGAAYIGGVAFYKMDGIMPFAHAIWHLFVIVGAMSHYYAIYTYLYADPDHCNKTPPFILDYIPGLSSLLIPVTPPPGSNPV